MEDYFLAYIRLLYFGAIELCEINGSAFGRRAKRAKFLKKKLFYNERHLLSPNRSAQQLICNNEYHQYNARPSAG